MTNTYLHLYFTRTTIPQGRITIFAYIPGVFWTIQHLTGTLAFKGHWPHDLAERRFNIITIIIFRRRGESKPARSTDSRELNRC